MRIIILLLVIIVFINGSARAGELLKNTDFKQGTKEWIVSGSMTGIQHDSDGNRFFCFDSRKEKLIRVFQKISLKPGKYVWRVELKTDKPGRVTGYIWGRNKDAGKAEKVVGSASRKSPGNKWISLSSNFTVDSQFDARIFDIICDKKYDGKFFIRRPSLQKYSPKVK